MTNSIFDDPQFNQAVFASVVVVLILLRRKQQSNNSALFRQRLTWDAFIQENEGRPELTRLLRMELDSFFLLLSYIRNFLDVDESKAASRGGKIIPELCLYCTLRYLAGASYLDIVVFAGISIPSFYRIVRKTIHAINSVDELAISFPKTFQECKVAAAGFENISFQSAIANCIGAIDGYLVAIDTPSQSDVGNVRSYFSGQYQKYGINIQAVCDHLCRFIFVAVAAPGSINDRDAIKETPLPYLLRNLPQGFVVIADAAYEATEYLVSLFYGVHVLDPENNNFNFYGSQCRIRVEMAFGMMSQKWGILKRPMSVKPSQCTNIVMCIARLHNFTINEHLKNNHQNSAKDTIDLIFQESNCNIYGSDTSNWSVDNATTTMPMDAHGNPVTVFGEEEFDGAPGLSTVRTEMVRRIAAKKLVRPIANKINRSNNNE